MTITDKTKVQRKSDVVFEKMRGKVFILDDKGDNLVELNETGSMIWEKVEKPLTVGQIGELMVEEYDVSMGEAVDDVKQLVKKLAELKLVRVN